MPPRETTASAAPPYDDMETTPPTPIQTRVILCNLMACCMPPPWLHSQHISSNTPSSHPNLHAFNRLSNAFQHRSMCLRTLCTSCSNPTQPCRLCGTAVQALTAVAAALHPHPQHVARRAELRAGVRWHVPLAAAPLTRRLALPSTLQRLLPRHPGRAGPSGTRPPSRWQHCAAPTPCIHHTSTLTPQPAQWNARAPPRWGDRAKSNLAPIPRSRPNLVHHHGQKRLCKRQLATTPPHPCLPPLHLHTAATSHQSPPPCCASQPSVRAGACTRTQSPPTRPLEAQPVGGSCLQCAIAPSTPSRHFQLQLPSTCCASCSPPAFWGCQGLGARARRGRLHQCVKPPCDWPRDSHATHTYLLCANVPT
jgi:hypothetical protein